MTLHCYVLGDQSIFRTVSYIFLQCSDLKENVNNLDIAKIKGKQSKVSTRFNAIAVKNMI